MGVRHMEWPFSRTLSRIRVGGQEPNVSGGERLGNATDFRLHLQGELGHHAPAGFRVDVVEHPRRPRLQVPITRVVHADADGRHGYRTINAGFGLSSSPRGGRIIFVATFLARSASSPLSLSSTCETLGW